VQLWPCTDPKFFDAVIDDGIPGCLNRPVSTTADGSAVCLITATYSGTDPCPAELCWSDPVGPDGTRAPRIDHDASGDMRVCEVLQLQGAALASCVGALDCADCGAGWCSTVVPELAPSARYCPPNTYYSSFRFVHGADAGPESANDVAIEIVCDSAVSG
jgi:hypothetical protein